MGRRLSLALLAALLVSAIAVSATAVAGRTAASSRAVVKTAYNKKLKKTIVVDAAGRTLYMLTLDTKGVFDVPEDPGMPQDLAGAHERG